MKALSMKGFVSQLNSRLNELSLDQLKKILLEQASKVPPAERQRFLDSLILTGSSKSEGPIDDDGARLLKEIDALVEEASLGEEEAWGWDDDYDHDYCLRISASEKRPSRSENREPSQELTN